MPSIRIPLVGSYTNRNTNATAAQQNDQQFQNCFPEIVINPITGKQSYVLNRRHGSTASADVQAGATSLFGSVVWSSNVSTGAIAAPVVMSFLKSGTSTSTMFFQADNLVQVGGDVPTTNNCLAMGETDAGGTATLTAALTDSATGSIEMWYFPTGGAWTQVTDANLISNLTPAHAHMDGYMFVMGENGRIQHSALNTVSTFPALNFITAGSFADRGVGVVRYKNYIVGFGDYSTEFFVNAGNATGSVLTRVQDATIGIGALRNGTTQPPAMKTIGDSVYWIGQNAASGARGVYRLKGLQAEKISNSGIDRLVSNGQMKYIIGSFNMFGMTHVAFNAASGFSVCYCVDTAFWWFLIPGFNLTPVSIIGAVDGSAISKSYLGMNGLVSAAKVFTFDPSSPIWQDNGIAYNAVVNTSRMDLGTRRMKIWDALTVSADMGSTSSAAMSVLWSDDDGVTFSASLSFNLSTSFNRFTRLGASRRRIWRFINSGAGPCRIDAIDLEYRLGSP